MYCDSQANHGNTDTNEATELPIPNATKEMGSAQQVVPSTAKLKPLHNEALVDLSVIFIVFCFFTIEAALVAHHHLSNPTTWSQLQVK